MENEISEELREKYEVEFVFSVWDKIRLWFLIRKIRRAKIREIWEAKMDKLFFETQFPTLLTYNEAEDREALLAERKKPLADQDEKRVQELENTITKAKAVRQAYRKNDEFIKESKSYLSMLDLWNNH